MYPPLSGQPLGQRMPYVGPGQPMPMPCPPLSLFFTVIASALHVQLLQASAFVLQWQLQSLPKKPFKLG